MKNVFTSIGDWAAKAAEKWQHPGLPQEDNSAAASIRATQHAANADGGSPSPAHSSSGISEAGAAMTGTGGNEAEQLKALDTNP